MRRLGAQRSAPDRPGAVCPPGASPPSHMASTARRAGGISPHERGDRPAVRRY